MSCLRRDAIRVPVRGVRRVSPGPTPSGPLGRAPPGTIAVNPGQSGNRYILCLFDACTTTWSVLQSETVELFALILAALAFAGSAAALYYSVWAARMSALSAPAELNRHMGAVRVEFKQVSERVADQDSKMLNWRVELEGLMEAVETILDSVESKRRSTAANVSRINRNEATAVEDVNQMDHAALEARARAQGLM